MLKETLVKPFQEEEDQLISKESFHYMLKMELPWNEYDRHQKIIIWFNEMFDWDEETDNKTYYSEAGIVSYFYFRNPSDYTIFAITWA